MSRLKNTTSYSGVHHVINPEGNAGNYIGLSDNLPIVMNSNDVKRSWNILYTMDNCLNQCQKGFLGGLESTVDEIVVEPMEKDGIVLETTLRKSLKGLFEIGDGKGCKDDSYVKWKQPLMNDVETPLGTCQQTVGENIRPAYYSMNGIYNQVYDGWKSRTAVSTWHFESVVPFVLQSMVISNLNDKFKTRLLSVVVDGETLVKDYYVNPDNFAKSYINISEELRKESNNLDIETSQSFYPPEELSGVGFAEVQITAETRYIQQDSLYKVFLIKSSEGVVDVLVSNRSTPILPEGFTQYTFVRNITTSFDRVELVPTYGNVLKFHTELYPTVITINGVVKTVKKINNLTVNWNDEELTHYFVSIDENGNSYATLADRDITSFLMMKDDVPTIIVGEIVCENGMIKTVQQYPCNFNMQYRYHNAGAYYETIPTNSITFPNPLSYEPSHNDVVLKCIKENHGYPVGTIIPTKTTTGGLSVSPVQIQKSYDITIGNMDESYSNVQGVHLSSNRVFPGRVSKITLPETTYHNYITSGDYYMHVIKYNDDGTIREIVSSVDPVYNDEHEKVYTFENLILNRSSISFYLTAGEEHPEGYNSDIYFRVYASNIGTTNDWFVFNNTKHNSYITTMTFTYENLKSNIVVTVPIFDVKTPTGESFELDPNDWNMVVRLNK